MSEAATVKRGKEASRYELLIEKDQETATRIPRSYV
jgi:hypothetical protein